MRVLAIGVGSPIASSLTDERGEFELDLTPLAQRSTAALRSDLVVLVDEAGYLRSRTLVALRSSERDGYTELLGSAVIDLVRADTVLKGIVHTPEGTAPSYVEIALFALPITGDSPAPVDTARCGIDGHFELRSTGMGSFAVVAHHPTLRPATVLVEGGTRTIEPLDLMEGEHIRGTLSIGSLARKGIVRLTPTEGVPVRWKGLLWIEQTEKFEAGVLQVQADEYGRFDCPALAPLTYDVRPDLVGRSISFVRVSLEVLAPSDGVVIGENVAQINILVLNGSLPTPGAMVRLKTKKQVGEHFSTPVFAEESNGLPTGADGSVDAFVDPGASYSLEVTKAGFQEFRGALAETHPGELRQEIIGLTPETVTSSLDLVIEPAIDAKRVLVVLQCEPGGEQTTWDAPLDQQVLRIHGITPGTYRCVVIPRDSTRLYCSASFTSTCEAGRTTKRTVSFAEGGRLRIDARRMKWQPIDSKILGPDLIPVRFLRQTLTSGVDGPRWETLSESDSLQGGAFNEVAENLHPGEYRLLLTDSVGSTTEAVANIEKGRTTTLLLQ